MRLHLLLAVINVARIPINYGDSDIGFNQRHVVPRDKESELRSHDRTDQKDQYSAFEFRTHFAYPPFLHVGVSA